MKFIKLLLPVALFGFLNLPALEKPEGVKIDPSTADLQKDVDKFKAEGQLTPYALEARALETKRLADRVLELGLKQNKTPAEEQEFVLKRKEFESHMKPLLPKQ